MAKRLATVPPAVHGLGQEVSKATLLEMAFHLALRLQGEEDGAEALTIMIEEARALGQPVARPPESRKGAWAVALRAALDRRAV